MVGDAVIVSTVENLSMNGAKPVENLLMKFFPVRDWAEIPTFATCGRRLRDPLRLIAALTSLRSTAFLTTLSDTKKKT